jgi:oxalate decarboxylase/phosphoglucose isomerase-like protein (cupin superfamily)
MSPGAGTRIGSSAMTLKVGAEQTSTWSVFEVEVQPGFDVGAHLHTEAEEFFYVLSGELDLLAFEPRVRTAGGWQAWESESGAKVHRGGPGQLMFVPAGCPHAFCNPGSEPVRMLFAVAPSGHEKYLAELAEMLEGQPPPDPAAIVDLRARHDIHQLTPLIPGRR